MPTQAYSAYGSQVRIGDGVALAPLTITAATFATPIVITTSAAHGVPIGDVSYGTVSGVLGNTAANGSWVIEGVTTTTLRLRNSVGNAAYTSGGTLTKVSTFAYVVELTNVQDAGSRTDLVDTSAHDGSGYSSQIPTMKRTNQMRLDVNLVPGHATHNETTGLLSLYNSSAYRHWLLVLPPYPGTGRRSTAHIYGHVNYYTETLPVNGVVAAQFTLAFDGAFLWAA
jgi:hypothetical protein